MRLGSSSLSVHAFRSVTLQQLANLLNLHRQIHVVETQGGVEETRSPVAANPASLESITTHSQFLPSSQGAGESHYTPSSTWRAITSLWISLVPSPMVVRRLSR